MTRTSRIAGVLIVAASSLALPVRAGETLNLAADASDLRDTLAGTLGPLDTQSQVAPGVRIVRQSQWDSTHKRLVLQSTLHIDSSAAPPREIPLLRLTFPNAGVPRKGPFFEKLEYRQTEWYGSTFWTGPNWTRVGRDWHHPGQDTPSVRRFQVPRDGRVTIFGRVYKLHLAGDGVCASILHQDKPVWKAQIDGDDSQGLEPHLTLDVRKGDVLRFVVDKRKAIACDTTHWDPVIAFAGGTTYQASKSFGNRDGRDGWSYEMLVDKPSSTQETCLHAMGRDLLIRPGRSIAGTPIAATSDEILPLFVLADGKGSSGMTVSVRGAARWTLQSAPAADGPPTVSLIVTCPAAGYASVELPELWICGFRGPWTAAATTIGEMAGPETVAAWQRLSCEVGGGAEFDLAWIVQSEWLRDDKIDDTAKNYAAAVTDHLARVREILASRASAAHSPALLDAFADEAARPDRSLAQWRTLYLKTRLLKRSVMLADPLLDFRQLVVCKRVPPSWSHLVAQYYGWRQRPGGSLFVLEKPGRSLAAHDILAGQLAPGDFLEPALSYDGRRIAFSYVACSKAFQPGELPVNEGGPDEAYFHIYEIGVDGSGLRQLTQGPYDDMMPCYLPDGRIAFTSTRRKGYSRCFGPEYSKRWHSYTLHCIDGDGRNLRTLSWNDVSEWFPTVSNKGEILFARWDYIDRDAVTHQNLWAMRPDGTNPVAVWGNATPKPHCAFQARSIPDSNKIVFIGSAHHAITAGPVVVLDPSVDPNRPEAITRITPGPFPEAESSSIPEYYESPWPLSERLFLVAYSAERLRFQGEHPRDPNPDNALGIYVLDAAGNRELVYRDPHISSTSPRPLQARPAPPVIASAIAAHAPPTGEMMLTDVYQGLGDAPRGSIKRLRIVQVFPKTTPVANSPRVGVAGEENARAILGTVPVEPDGSARFLLPAGKPVLFQALDEQGFAYRTMRSLTYVQPGERTACIGCHEHPQSAPPAVRPLAMQRAASAIEPGELGGRPFSFVEVVQPVLDKRCVECHNAQRADGGVDLSGTPLGDFTRSYWSLCGLPANPAGQKRDVVPPKTAPLVPRFAQRNQIQTTPPGGVFGARGSRLIKLLLDGHENVKLTPGELQRIAAWVDLNAIFYGGYSDEQRAAQLQGKTIAMPAIQ